MANERDPDPEAPASQPYRTVGTADPQFKDKMQALSEQRRQKIEARAAELIAEELSLRNLRQAHLPTQQRMDEFLGIGQEGVSRLEK